MKSDITVSIFVICYNQRDTILQTLESVNAQITDFQCELIISDDSSTDQTRLICENFTKKHPEKNIILLEKMPNVGLIENYKRAILASKGKYIAGCAGDDYWEDDLKLQKQVDFLEANPDFGMVHTNYKILRTSTGNIQDHVGNYPSGNIFNELLQGNFIVPITAVYKKNLVLNFIKDGFLDRGFLMEDYPVWLYISETEKIKHIEVSTAVYRKNVESLSYSQNPKKNIAFRLSVIDIQIIFAQRNNQFDAIKVKVLRELKFLLVDAFKNDLKDLVKKIYNKIETIERPSKKDDLLYRSFNNLISRNISLAILKARDLF